MIKIIYGQDNYLVLRDARTRIRTFVKEHPNTEVASFECTKEEIDRLEGSVKNESLFSNPRVFHIKYNEKYSKPLFKILKSYGITEQKGIFLIVSAIMSPKKQLVGLRNIAGLIQDTKNDIHVIPSLDNRTLPAWINTELHNYEINAEPDVIRELISLSGNDIGKLANEILKLANAAQGQTITMSDVRKLVTPNIDLNTFVLVDTIAGRDKKKALALLYKTFALAPAQDHYSVFGAIVYQFRNLLTISDLLSRGMSQADILKKTGLHPYVVSKTLSQSKKFTVQELKTAFGKLADIDITMKQGRGELSEELYRFMLE